MSQDWEEKLSEEFEWRRDEPSPENVAEEAKEYGFESISELISKMEDAPSTCYTGFKKWKYFRNWGRAFGMSQIRDLDS